MKVKIKKSQCMGCQFCKSMCALGAISFERGLGATVDEEKCNGCGKCIAQCPVAAITKFQDVPVDVVEESEEETPEDENQ